jgi:hypothetical protein
MSPGPHCEGHVAGIMCLSSQISEFGIQSMEVHQAKGNWNQNVSLRNKKKKNQAAAPRCTRYYRGIAFWGDAHAFVEEGQRQDAKDSLPSSPSNSMIPE